MRVSILEDENDNLHEQLVEEEDRIDELEQVNNGRQEELHTAHSSLETAQSELRLKAREIETLRVSAVITIVCD